MYANLITCSLCLSFPSSSDASPRNTFLEFYLSVLIGCDAVFNRRLTRDNSLVQMRVHRLKHHEPLRSLSLILRPLQLLVLI